MYGNSPRKLLNRIRENSDTNRKILPLLILFPPSTVLNSLCSFVNSVFNGIGYKHRNINCTKEERCTPSLVQLIFLCSCEMW